MARKSLMKAFDDRSGRLERAMDLIQDGQNPKLMVTRGEADRFNPQSIKRRVPPDRVHLKGGAFAPERMIGRFIWMVGYTADSNFARPEMAAVVQGYNYAKYIYTNDVTGGGFGFQGFGFFGFGGVVEVGVDEGEFI